MKTNPALYTVRIVSKIDMIQVIDVSKRSLALYLCPRPAHVLQCPRMPGAKLEG